MPAKRIVDFITNTNHDILDRKVGKFTRIFILDTIGASLDGIEMLTKSGQATYLERSKSNPLQKKASVIGTRHRASVEEAFQCNARSCSRYDQDGLEVPAQTYPGRQVILAALAASEKLNVSINEAITAIIIVYELLLRTGHIVRDIGWAPDSNYPSKRLCAYCFTVQGVASVLLRIIQLGLENAEIATNSGPAKCNYTLTGRSLSPNQNRRLSLIFEILQLLKNGTVNGFFSVYKADEGIIDEIVDKIAASRHLTYRLGQKYFLLQQGYKPALINRYLHHPLAAVKLTLENKRLYLNSIQSIALEGLSHIMGKITKCSLEKARSLMAFIIIPISVCL